VKHPAMACSLLPGDVTAMHPLLLIKNCSKPVVVGSNGFAILNRPMANALLPY